MHFMHSLQQAWQDHDSLVCVGLDPEPVRFPVASAGHADAVFGFCLAIVDATADLVCAFRAADRALRRAAAPRTH